MWRSVDVLDLPDAVKLKLKDLGYELCEDLEKALTDNANKMPSNLKLIADNYNVLEQLKPNKTEVISAVDLWNFECFNPPVAIFHEGLDKLLKGGFPIGQITELCGAPGTGKTQICLQAAVDVQIPSDFGGSSGQSLFISTDFGFKVERLRQIARETVKHVSNIRKLDGNDVGLNFTEETVLSGVNVVQICGYKSLCEIITNLENLPASIESVKLVIIDSFSLPLVCELTDLLERTKTVHILLDALQELCVKHKFAILLTNQLTTVITPNAEKKLIPCLGEGFGHRIQKRLLLDEGKICLMKSTDQPQLFTEFQITEAGIR